jgi:hypothetical protein
MALIILPRKSDSDIAEEEAQQKFKTAIDDPLTVLMVVYGEDSDTPKILEVCCARASTKAAIRRVVWIPDTSVLCDEQKKKYWLAKYPAVSIGLDNKRAKALTKAKAKVAIYVEQAFLHAESQGGD